MCKVIVYSRVSTSNQSLEQQERTVFEWLKNHNMKATQIISDEGVSGGVSYSERNLGKEIIPELKEGDVLVVSEISRLGRSMSDINKLVNDELKPRKARLVVVQMGIDLDCSHIKALDEMILYSFGFAAQLEKELIQSRTQSAIEVRKRKLAEDGSFVSKKGNVCTHLGRDKGCDMNRAVKKSAIIRTNKARENERNQSLWGFFTNFYSEISGVSWTEVANQLNCMKYRTAKGKEFDRVVARSTYESLKKIFDNKQN